MHAWRYNAKTMRRTLILILLSLAVLLFISVGAGAWLLNDEGFLKSQVFKYTKRYTGRDLVIAGPLDLQIGGETTLDARNIRFQNAEWAASPDMVNVGHLRITVDVRSLFRDLPLIPLIQLEDCVIALESNAAGQDNWAVLPPTEKPETEDKTREGLLPVEVHLLEIDDCRLTNNSPKHETPLDIRVRTVRLERLAGDRLETELAGELNGERLEIGGWLAPASAFNHGGELQHELVVRAGRVTLESSGSVADLNTLASPQFRAHYHGPAIEDVLGRHGLPRFAEGAFDLRATLDSSGGATRINVDGDIGNLGLAASGELDRLLRPGSGKIETHASGPNLQALGEAFGLEGLVPEAFDWSANFTFEREAVAIENARLATGLDVATVSGHVSTAQGMPDSRLVLALQSEEIGRWSPLFGKTWNEQGAMDLDVTAMTDSGGVLSIDGSVMQGASALQVKGSIGPLAGPYEPDLDLAFSSSEMPRLASLFNQPALPGGRFNMQGRFRKAGSEIQLDDIELSLNRHRAVVGGRVVLEENFGGSDLDIHLEIPNLADFGKLFDRPNLPAEPVMVNATLKPEGKGLAFRIDKSEVGEIRLAVDGRIECSGYFAKDEAGRWTLPR